MKKVLIIGCGPAGMFAANELAEKREVIGLKVDKNMETSVRNLYAAENGCGLSRDIINAAATGILVATAILNTS